MSAQSDRELLELAAKAARLDFVPSDHGLTGYIKGVLHKPWNPLMDDGALLRLVIACSIDLRFDDIERVVEARHQHTTYGEHEEYGSDKNAATRRAGVRAAAAIGEKMP